MYAPAVHFTMSDGIEYGDISSLQLVTATAHFDTPMRWVDDEGADFSTEGAVITGWALLDDSTYDLGESSCRACFVAVLTSALTLLSLLCSAADGTPSPRLYLDQRQSWHRVPAQCSKVRLVFGC